MRGGAEQQGGIGVVGVGQYDQPCNRIGASLVAAPALNCAVVTRSVRRKVKT
jgi:hypothetical protein